MGSLIINKCSKRRARHMKKFLVVLSTILWGFGISGVAQANLIQNGNFNSNLTGWTTNGDVQIANTGFPILGGFASAQGMDGNYALLGLWTTNETSTLRQDIEITGIDKLIVSFNWAFDYLDSSNNNEDEFISFMRQDGNPARTITFGDLVTKGTSSFTDAGIAYGYYNEIIDISEYTKSEARVIFRLIEEGGFFGGTASIAGIDNVDVSAAPVPEPATMLLLGSGLIGLGGFRKRFFKR
jgi:hypothetical protein